MASDPPRRRPSSSAAQSSNPGSSASPLNPAKAAAANTKSAFARFVPSFGAYSTSRPSSLQNKTEVQKPQHHGPPRFPNRPNPLASQNISYDTKLEINSLDMNQERTHVVLAGRHQLQTFYVNDKSCTPKLNLREALTRQDNESTGRLRAVIDLHDVKWSNGRFNTFIAGAATSNGRISLFDVTRPGIEVARLHEHSQQVLSIAFNPHQGNHLLSGGLDGAVKLWNIDDAKREQISLRSKGGFPQRARPTMDPITDVKWSPTDGVEFAIGTRAGVIERWDIRQPLKPLLRIPAHSTRCSAVDWHPDGKHILSAGEDQWIRVWDFSVEKSDRKAKWELKCPYPIAHSRWRPTCFSSGPSEGKGQWQTTQLVTAYERNRLPVVHIWDFRRPHLPFREISDFSSPPCSLLWHSPDLLWSATREGVFHQSDLKYAQKPLEWRPKVPFAISPMGEVVAFHAAKTNPKKIPELFPKANEKRDLSITSANRGSFDDSIDESFLVSSYNYKPHHSRRESNRSAKSASSTPPAASAVRNPVRQDDVIPFDIVMSRKDEVHAPPQKAFRGRLPGHANPLLFIFLAQKLQTDPSVVMTRLEALLRLRCLFEKNAAYYERAGMHRGAQTWRTLSLMVWAELCDRARLAYKSRKAKETDDILALAEPCPEPEQGGFVAVNQYEVSSSAAGVIAVVREGEENIKTSGISESRGEEEHNDLEQKARSVKSSIRRLELDNDVGFAGGSTSEMSTPRARPHTARGLPVPHFTLPDMAVASLIDTPEQSSPSLVKTESTGTGTRDSSPESLGSPKDDKVAQQLPTALVALPQTSSVQTEQRPQSSTRPRPPSGRDDAGGSIHDPSLSDTDGADVGVGPGIAGTFFRAGELEERRAGLSNWRAQPRMLLVLDSPGLPAQPEGLSYRPTGQYQQSLTSNAAGASSDNSRMNTTRPTPLDRHNSDESFGMFSTSPDSQRVDLSDPGSLSSRQSDHIPPPATIRLAAHESSAAALSNLPRSTSRIAAQSEISESAQSLEEVQDQGVSSRFNREPWSGYCGMKGSGSLITTQPSSFTTDESTDYSVKSPTPAHSHERNYLQSGLHVVTLSHEGGQTTINNTKKLDSKPAKCSTHVSAPPSVCVNGLEGDKIAPSTAQFLLSSLAHPSHHRQLSKEDLSALTIQAVQILGTSASEAEQQDFLAKLDISDFDPTPASQLQDLKAIDLQELLVHLQRFYTQCAPDSQMLETITRFLDFALHSPSDARNSELETAIWLSYNEQLHRHAQHTVANHLAGVTHAQAKAEGAIDNVDPFAIPSNTILSAKAAAIEWPNSTIGVNCGKCDKPANGGICTSCNQRLGLCSYCWQRHSPYPYPSRSKKSRDLEILAVQQAIGPVQGLWSFCTACNHGVHAGCREQRRKEAALEGRWDRCPVPGCLCVCVVGQGGDGAAKVVPEAEVVLGSGERKVKESRAVKEVKFALQ